MDSQQQTKQQHIYWFVRVGILDNQRTAPTLPEATFWVWRVFVYVFASGDVC